MEPLIIYLCGVWLALAAMTTCAILINKDDEEEVLTDTMFILKLSLLSYLTLIVIIIFSYDEGKIKKR